MRDRELEQKQFTELVDRATRKEPGGREALLRFLRPWSVGVLLGKFSHLAGGHAQMLEDAEKTLLRWLHENPDLVRRHQSPGILVWRLLAQVAKDWVRQREHEREGVEAFQVATLPGNRHNESYIWHSTAEVETGYEVTGSDAARGVALLGEPHRSTLLAEVEHQLRGGPSLEEAFGLTPAAARQRLCRAREALLTVLREGRKEGES
jgi:hypothetical protein